MSDNEPLVPADADVRGFTEMPMEVMRLLDSETWIMCTPEERSAAINLWFRAWVQVPAGSLPDNDRVLAHMSMAGERWKDVKEMALRGWEKANDGRLYHQVVCEKVLKLLEVRARKSAAGKQGGNKPKAEPKQKRSSSKATAKQQLNDKQATGKPLLFSSLPSSSSEAKASGASAPPTVSLEVEFFREGKALFGENSGGLLAKAKSQRGIDKAMGLLMDAKDKENPKEWFAKAVKLGTEPGSSTDGMGLGYVPLQFAE